MRMNDTPTFPVFMIDRKGWVLGATDITPLSRTSLTGLCHASRAGVRYYDAAGSIWTSTIARAPYPVNIWTRMLSQVYNPLFAVELGWTRAGTFTLAELQDELCRCVDADDDILTQFMEPEKLKALIRETGDFTHLFRRMKKMNII